VTKYISKYTRKMAPYVPAAIKDNWITILSIVFIAWFTYTSVLLYNTAHEARQTSKSAQHLSSENRHRITDIQEQRIRSCQLTYQSIYDVLQPFFPKGNTTPKQRADQVKFEEIIRDKKKGCTKQVLKTPRKINPPKLRIH
jgi:hypothetical protein